MAAAASVSPVPVSAPSHISGGIRRIIHTATSVDEGRFVPGTLIAGRYRITSLLGRGGMGEVYRATDLTLAQSVALKFLPESAAGNERLLERFHNEVRVARQVSHANVCRVYDIGEADGIPFISMEYVDGEDLASLLARIGRLPADKALEIARKLCAGVAAAHDRAILHRDLKPHNIMLNRRGEVVIMDFGLAAVAEELRGSEARNGTPAYMAPEQLRGENVTQRSDIYAIGLIIYELFTGRRAWEAESIPELIERQEATRPPSMTTLASDADPAVEKVVLRCLQADPLQRPASALAVAAALPGGDPLAAALAAGEMPSPELVASSGKTQGIALRYALPMLALVTVGIIAMPFARQGTYLLSTQELEHPPAVLSARAREIASAFGYTNKPQDWHGQLYVEYAALRHFEKKPGPKDWVRLLSAELPYRYRYLQSPQYLIAPPDGYITDDRPAFTEPGMVRVQVDSAGRLRSFDAVVPRWMASQQKPAELDIAQAFRFAGLDHEKFKPAAPRHVPLQAFDARQAWEGVHPGLPDVPLTVELASFQGRLTGFHIRYPWTDTSEVSASRDVAGWQRAFGLFTMLVLATGLFCAVFVAWRNFKAGRGDRRGAVRVAFAMFTLFMAGWTLRQHWMPHEAMWNFLFQEVFWAIGASLLMATLYLALEPLVRARWPHTLITWSRLLAGNVRDARVGSHVLIGAAIGVVISYVFHWRVYMRASEGLAPAAQDLKLIQGTGFLAAEFVSLLSSAVLVGSVIFFVLSGVRALVRYDWLAALIASLILAAQERGLQNSSNIWLDAPVYVLIFAALAFLLLRLGLVSAIACILFINTSSRLPVPADFGSWHTGYLVAQIVYLIAIAFYAFVRSQSESGPASQTV
ncbi:MAG TPA: serine/threonine-protein kinase [Bryobacteraceae bacterium]|nr:serine/threonine-protein kinase [Bryobacteraceae bacterium]